MRNDRNTWNIFVRYLAGECSEREKAEVDAWIAVDEEQGRLFDQIRDIWEGGAKPARPLDTRMAWKKLDDRIRQEEKIKPMPLRVVSPRPPAAQRPRLVLYPMLYAAAAIVAIAFGLVFWQNYSVSAGRVGEAANEERVFATRKGQQATIQLVDGTKVQLNADSKLIVAADFAEGSRNVRLEGQAYFKVARNERQPFTVKMKLGSVQVLGTEFDVDAYPGADRVQVVVKEGSVSLRAARQAPTDTVVLRQKDVGLLLEGGKRVVHRNVPLESHISWQEQRLVFKNAPFSEVARELEQWYDLDIEVAQPLGNVDGLTASFRDEPLDEILDAITAALGLRYEKSGRKVKFYRANRPATI